MYIQNVWKNFIQLGRKGIQRAGFFSIFLFLTFFCFQNVNSQIRNSSAPYLSGDTFRGIADFLYDETTVSFDPMKVKSGDIIFVKTDMLEGFFNEKHHRILNPYILISHNSDDPISENFARYLDDSKLIVWFAQNVDNYRHNKLIPIPIGIANQYWNHGSIKTFNLAKKRAAQSSKSYLLTMNFSNGSFPKERVRLWQLLSNKAYCYTPEIKSHLMYLLDLAKSKFVLSPRGNGIDCHRTWETLYMGGIPVVMSSTLDDLFEGLPVLVVGDWGEINQKFLEKKWIEFRNKEFNNEKLFFPYWKKLILKYKNDSTIKEWGDLINEMPEIYQDILVNNKVIKKGIRSSEDRYNAIRKVLGSLPKNFKALDLGASQGYFSFRMANEFGARCIMIEDGYLNSAKHWKTGDLLHGLCMANSELKKLTLLKKKVCLKDLEEISKKEKFDVVLAFSVIHHLRHRNSDSFDTFDKAIEHLLNLAPVVLIENPQNTGIHTRYIREKLIKNNGKVIFSSNRGQLLYEIFLFDRRKSHQVESRCTDLSAEIYNSFNGSFKN
ncbi:MAG: hypothetical protein K9M07_05165 [Simkaniaceae bacterium]|nr:hypothetical protein [Simkaniaceae bacterium]